MESHMKSVNKLITRTFIYWLSTEKIFSIHWRTDWC